MSKKRRSPSWHDADEERAWLARKSIVSGYEADDEKMSLDGESGTVTIESDPFRALCWDCGSMILEHLDVLDLLQCEQVNKGWREFVKHWIAVRGYLFFPETWKPHLRDVEDVDERLTRAEEAAVKYAQYLRVKTGRASGVREINSATSFKVAGDFAVWTVGTKVLGRRLGFQENGATYPTRTWDLTVELTTAPGTSWVYHSVDLQVGPGGHVHMRIFRDGEFEDRMMLIQTGEELWRKTYPVVTFMGHHNVILAMSETSMYSASRMHNSDDHCYYYVHDLNTGDVWHWSHLPDFTLAQFPPLCLRRIRTGGQERDVLVAFSFAEDPSAPNSWPGFNMRGCGPGHLDGLRVIDSLTGGVLQTVRFPICSSKILYVDPPQLLASPENKSEIAVVCRHRTQDGGFVFKVDRFSFDAAGTLYKARTEAMRHRPDAHCDANCADTVDFTDHSSLSIDPFRYIFLNAKSTQHEDMPAISAIEPCGVFDAVDDDGDPIHTDVKVDAWFQDGSCTKISVPGNSSELQNSAALMRERSTTVNTVYRLDCVGENKLLLLYESWAVHEHDILHYLFDFDFRRRVEDRLEADEHEDTSMSELVDTTGSSESTVSSTSDMSW
ncbi:F-box protein [Aspergillus mulundensis]|uniref:F-box domain-containing protein n=1 Tax=Aspergillus mulundensis TaxID=1810919 RepID=A0A3D8QRQ0_9EURO|nr:hypothetical protein DSM5745_09883 [Aspergillus mulundensis]RDW64472.1 hypothetical protein DSM5745_09883 [Aspergillus mulundensis]